VVYIRALKDNCCVSDPVQPCDGAAWHLCISSEFNTRRSQLPCWRSEFWTC